MRPANVKIGKKIQQADCAEIWRIEALWPTKLSLFLVQMYLWQRSVGSWQPTNLQKDQKLRLPTSQIQAHVTRCATEQVPERQKIMVAHCHRLAPHAQKDGFLQISL
jgi:hypothetical protein